MIELSPDEARLRLLAATGLSGAREVSGLPGALEVLDALGCVQLDPLDRVGTNADLVLHARVDALRRGDWARLMPRHAFEHFAKERCLLPARLFPAYRARVFHTRWWQQAARMEKIPEGVLDEVLAELRARGPLAPANLTDRGRVDPLDWSGWKGTGRVNALALEVLWTRCQVVTAGRTAGGERVYDVPERALPGWHDQADVAPEERLLLQRARSAGLLSTATGPHWSMLAEVRESPLPGELVARGALCEVRITGSRRTYLADPALLAAPLREPDDRMRVLGPLDPVLWDRKLVEHIFGFDYVWEVYKPEAQRRWGYYVKPLLHRGRLVGRIEARRVAAESGFDVRIDRIWPEAGVEIDGPALDEAMARLTRLQAPAAG